MRIPAIAPSTIGCQGLCTPPFYRMSAYTCTAGEYNQRVREPAEGSLSVSDSIMMQRPRIEGNTY